MARKGANEVRHRRVSAWNLNATVSREPSRAATEENSPPREWWVGMGFGDESHSDDRGYGVNQFCDGTETQLQSEENEGSAVATRLGFIF